MPGVQVNPQLAAPMRQDLGMGHQSGWEGLAGGGVPGGSIFDTSHSAPEIDEATLDDIAEQAISELGFPAEDVMAEDPELAYGGLFRVRDDEWDTLEEEELLIDDDEEFGWRGRGARGARRRFAAKHPRAAAMMMRRRRRRRRHDRTPIPGESFVQGGSAEMMPFDDSVVQSGYRTAAFGVQPGTEPAPPFQPPALAPTPPGQPPQEGTFVGSMKMGAGLALGFVAVSLGIALLTGRK
jgi:hypothetical protein